MNRASAPLTVAQASDLIRARKLSPLEYVDELAARIQALDGQLHTFIKPTFEEARVQARSAEQEIMAGRWRGPLHGIPFGAKDVIETAGIETTGGSRLCRGHVPSRDAAVIAAMYRAGAVLMGKLATHEFAHGGPSFDLPWPVVRNPWDLLRFSGGSSSGSAAAVAAGLLPVTLGTDTGGSVRGPASFCGVAGFMPSTGLVSRIGVMPNSYTLDHCGPLAWTVEDCAIVLQALAGHDPADGNSFEQGATDYRAALGGGVRGLRVGVLRHAWEEDLPAADEHRHALEEAVETLRRLGARVEDCRVRPMRDYLDVKIVIGESEIFSVHHANLVTRAGEFGQDFLTRILAAVMFQSYDYLAASRQQRRMMAWMQPLYERYDVFLAPGFGAAGPIAAQRPMNFWLRANPHVMANVIGGPALALCCGFSAGGLPLGMQFMGPPLSDAAVLRAGHAYEQATSWRARRPQLEPNRAAPTFEAPVITPDLSQADAGTRELAARLAAGAGLRLTESQLAILFEAAPQALALARRIPRGDDRLDEPPAQVLRLPG